MHATGADLEQEVCTDQLADAEPAAILQVAYPVEERNCDRDSGLAIDASCLDEASEPEVWLRSP
jgi:hypothetical protein